MITAATRRNIARAAAILRTGGIVAFPTETVYGLGAGAFNPLALARIFDVKNRPRFDPLIVHLAVNRALGRIADVTRLSSMARRRLKTLCRAFWPGPLTLILPKRAQVPAIVSAGLDTVAVRLPRHPAARALIARAGGAVAAPSANPFGYLSPTRAEHVEEQLGGAVDMILDGGPCDVGVESTVLDLCGAEPVVLRQGGVSVEELASVLAEDELSLLCAAAPDGVPAASPGQLAGHYAPRTPLTLFERGAVPPEDGSAVIYFSRADRAAAPSNVFFLSEEGDSRTAAAALFELLHRLDAEAWQHIYAEKAPDEGLGRAINDRLRRAACASHQYTRI